MDKGTHSTNEARSLIGNFALAVETLNTWLAIFAGIACVLMGLAVTRETVGRYYFDSPTDWGVPANEVTLVIITFFGGAYTLMKGGHVGVDFIYKKFKGVRKLFVDSVICLCILSFSYILVWKGWDQAWYSFSKGVVLPDIVAWPKGPLQVLVPIGAFLLGLQAIINLGRSFYHELGNSKKA